MSADDHLGPQFNVRVGEKFAHRDYTHSNAPQARAAREADPDNPKHYEKFLVAHVHASGAATVKPYPVSGNSTSKRMTPDELQAKAVPWGKRMDPRKLGYPRWQPGQD